MEKLHFITGHGVCGFTYEWNPTEDGVKWDAEVWISAFGDRIGSGTAPLPGRDGFIDLSQFAVVQSN